MPKEYKRDKRSPIPKSEKVSLLMSKIRSSNTTPEIIIRKALYAAGLRGYRLNYKKLPGKPDIVFNRKKVAIFINGCYWHGCEYCGWKAPKHNTQYWTNKINANKERDKVKQLQIIELGYQVLVIWEHEIKRNLQGTVMTIKQLLA